ncbi:plastid division protein PDV2-like, partial [Morus notabilis]|uniref:plastid division protein PDV2-like n=2 Tax=Morus notabilis TaxID=981085 RepID=UPI000CED62F0
TLILKLYCFHYHQALQQQQRYEREAALAEIEQSRKTLLDKLKDYKGEQLEVINEASAFAGETVERNNDLLLPPYPTRPPQSLRRDNGYLPSLHKIVRNGVTSGDATNGEKKDPHELERNKNSRGMGSFLGVAAKTVLTLVGVVSVLSLSGFGPKFSGRETPLKLLSFFNQQASEEKRSSINCPPGKILVVENGEARCLVKERVEVPFSSAAAKPDVNYGCG